MTKQVFIVDVTTKSFVGSVVAMKESSFVASDMDGQGYGDPLPAHR